MLKKGHGERAAVRVIMETIEAVMGDMGGKCNYLLSVFEGTHNCSSESFNSWDLILFKTFFPGILVLSALYSKFLI